MRRITLWLFSTVAAVVLLFSYRTSTGSAGSATVAAAQAPITQPTSSSPEPSTSASASPKPRTSATASPKPGASASASPKPSRSASASPKPSAATTSKATTSTGPKTYSDSVAGTRWGDVQVTITVTDGKITDVAVPVYPNGNGRDQQINAYALPVLRQETLAAQNASINTVSGATVTSDGYLQSLQSALDAAHLS